MKLIAAVSLYRVSPALSVAAGLIASITDAQNHTTTYQYDSLGDRTAIIDPINGRG
jgi:YD repeat-containing protein